jgi:hypothetical protein
MQWIVDWCFVRGVNMLLPHAFYYSIRGPRFDERPPDVGPHSAWWDDYKTFADYCRRLCWLGTDSRHVCNVAILGEADRLPWRAAKICFQNQRDFNYLETRDLTAAKISDKGIFLSGMNYQAVVLEGDYALSAAEEKVLAQLKRAGRVLVYDAGSTPDAGAAFIAELDRIAPREFSLSPHPNLRYRHVRKGEWGFYLLFNEGAQEIRGDIRLNAAGETFWLDARSGEVERATDYNLRIEPYQMKIFSVRN